MQTPAPGPRAHARQLWISNLHAESLKRHNISRDIIYIISQKEQIFIKYDQLASSGPGADRCFHFLKKSGEGAPLQSSLTALDNEMPRPMATGHRKSFSLLRPSQ